MLMRFIVCVLLVFGHTGFAGAAGFNGKAHLEFQPRSNSYNSKVLKPLIFTDRAGRKWRVPSGVVVNGASIPRVLYSITGGPYDGGYLRASIIHDHYCVVKTRGWRNTHRMFLDAMLIDGVPELKAKAMYAAVLYFGPRWAKEYGITSKGKPKTYIPPYDKAAHDKIVNWIQANNPSIDEIDKLVKE